MSTERATGRAAEVWRRQRPGGRDMSGRPFWTNMTLETWASLAGAVFLFLQLAVEPALWFRWPPWQISRSLLGWITLVLLLLTPVSGLLIEHYLVRRRPPGTSVPFRVRAAFFLLGGVPWLGLLLIPWWRRAPAWALRPTAPRLDLEAPPSRLPRGSPLHRVYASGAFGLWLIVSGLFLPLSAALWLVAGQNRGLILGTCVALHLAQAACLAIHAESELRFTAQPRRTLRLLPWLCLLPQPVPIVAFLAMAWPVLEGARGKTLVWSAYARRTGVGRLPRWLDLRLSLEQRMSSGPWTGRWTLPQDRVIPEREGRAETVRTNWMRAKSLLLAIEAALLVGSIVRLTGREPDLPPWLLAAGCLASLGLLHATAGALCRLLRLRLPKALDPPAAGLSLFITQTALAFGLLAGPLAANGRFRELALLTAYSAALAAMLSVLLMLSGHLIFKSSLSLATLVTWPASFLILIVPALALVQRPDLAWIGLGLVMLVPVADVLIGVWCLPWLLYPFRWRDVFNGEVAWGTRVRLTFMTLIALLPLGGVALPAWTGLRPPRL